MSHRIYPVIKVSNLQQIGSKIEFNFLSTKNYSSSHSPSPGTRNGIIIYSSWKLNIWAEYRFNLKIWDPFISLFIVSSISKIRIIKKKKSRLVQIMRQNIRMAFLIRLTMIVSVPGIYLLINNSLEISSATPATDDEIRESINMNTNTNTRRRQQHESKYWKLKKTTKNRFVWFFLFDTFSIPNSIKGPSSSSSSRHLLAIIDEPLRTSEATTATRPAIFNFPTDSIDFKGNKTVRLALLSLIACYIFWMLAIICDEFFVPSIQILCQSKCHLSIVSKCRRVFWSFSMIFLS